MNVGRVSDQPQIIVVERRVLLRELLVSALKDFASDVHGFASCEDWHTQKTSHVPALILLSVSDIRPAEDICRGIGTLAKFDVGVPIVIFSNSADAELVVQAIEAGASGYVSADLTFPVFYEALRLVIAGGSFVPPGSLVLNSRRAPANSGRGHSTNGGGAFTKRQFAVIDALRKGKSNKTIAYELNMCESTVKVHVRNIMRRLRAKNRTEVAFLTQMHPGLQG